MPTNVSPEILGRDDSIEGLAAKDRITGDRVPDDRHVENQREREALANIDRVRAKPPRFRDEQITMAHGAGGKATATLVRGLFVPAFASDILERLDDSATLQLGDTQVAITTDSFVVKPLQFPGGSIGDLAVNGTVNDLAVAGAKPRALTLALVLEEGLPADVLRREVDAIARAAAAAGVSVVTGDTKVVERGHADGMYICTTGIGQVDPRAVLSPQSLRPGDHILVSGCVGEHGTAIMLARGEFELDAAIVSDTRSLWPVVDRLLDVAGPSLRCMRDATRGGVASVLNELAVASDVAVLVEERVIPVHPAVAGACEMLGIDPMYVANEGKLVAVVAPEAAEKALHALRSIPGCEEAADIGMVHSSPHGMVLVQTAFGGRRVMDLLVGDPLPRIC
jgi:hydrogenase expression/formation protein HypE